MPRRRRQLPPDRPRRPRRLAVVRWTSRPRARRHRRRQIKPAGGADIAGDDGDDVIKTGAGEDQVNGGDGDDDVDGGAGQRQGEAGLGVDTVSGGDGNDDLRVRDGVADTGRCGAAKKVEADTLDDVASTARRSRGSRRRSRRAAARPDATAPAQGPGRRPTVQRAGKALPARRDPVRARDDLRVGLHGVAGLSLPISTYRQRVGVGGGGVELTFKLNARERREAARAWAAPAQGRADRRRRHRPRRQLRRSRRRRSGYFAKASAARCAEPTWRCPPRP